MLASRTCEGGGYVEDDVVWSVDIVRPAERQCGPTRRDEPVPSPPVAFECFAVEVPTNTVELDRHPTVRIREVALAEEVAGVVEDSVFEHRWGKPPVDEKAGDHPTPVAQGHAFLSAPCFQKLTKRSAAVSSSASMADQNLLETGHVGSAFSENAVERCLQATNRDHRTEIENRSGETGARNAISDGGGGAVDLGRLMQPYAGKRPPATMCDHHLAKHRAKAVDAMQVSRSSMARKATGGQAGAE